MTLAPYLSFAGTCREAMTRYRDIFGGDLTLMTWGEAPPDAGEVPPERAELIMHSTLVADGLLLMAADDPDSDGRYAGVQLSWSHPDGDTVRRTWEALSEGGTVTMPLAPTFWTSAFGVCTDRFGVPWMVSVEDPGAH